MQKFDKKIYLENLRDRLKECKKLKKWYKDNRPDDIYGLKVLNSWIEQTKASIVAIKEL